MTSMTALLPIGMTAKSSASAWNLTPYAHRQLHGYQKAAAQSGGKLSGINYEASQ